jgi:hypothetical protein
VKYAFVQRHRRVWPISVQCRVLRVSIAGYHEHFVRKASGAAPRCLSDDALLMHIKAVHLQGVAGARHPRGQGSGSETDAAPGHPCPRQAPLQGHHGQPRRYVQDAMRERAADLALLLADPNAYFYVCGLKAMEEGVVLALRDIAALAGLDWETLGATLQREGRLPLETY